MRKVIVGNKLFDFDMSFKSEPGEIEPILLHGFLEKHGIYYIVDKDKRLWYQGWEDNPGVFISPCFKFCMWTIQESNPEEWDKVEELLDLGP